MFRRSILAAAPALLAAPALAQGWSPDRPITMIVAFAPGGGTDVAARTVARFMERDLGQSILVLNRAGAGGEVGWSELARARPDGLTIGFINTPNLVTIPIERQARYRLEDFAPIANVVDDPGGFWVLPDSPWRTLADLAAAARAAPGTIGYGTTGVGSDDHLATLAFERLSGVKLLHVPFNGSSQVRNAILGKTIQLAAMNMGEGVGDFRNGLLRPLGQMAETRWSNTSDVPTFREQGFDVVDGSLRGLAAPAGTPPAVLERLANAVRKAMDDPDFKHAATQQQLPLRFLDPDQHRTVLMAMRESYTRMWQQHPWRD
ncbi:tripartite tricarboxylate transporter substrate binding protein [Sabulicella glaciei]|uniref:Tripartite tricarboxylate transporter substrate binding protein n=1 Tax=Sabulicella glaciei TaxID=2984948 RepID=A0ABT3NVB7_9PROT|nr:tripartite tricarboxylate transporter substrate binding protein [Roseococcus sp. MDT2-1-1]MCW8085494.1 tripartite tricarboxylate transporter substrate binding protein [Roseococcus sp. MDT2-1-1]